MHLRLEVIELFDLDWIKLRQFGLNQFASELEDYVRVPKLADQLPAFAARRKYGVFASINRNYCVDLQFTFRHHCTDRSVFRTYRARRRALDLDVYSLIDLSAHGPKH